MASAGQGGVVVAAPDERAVPPAFDDQPEEAVGDEGDEADQDGDVQRVARVEVPDVAQLVPDDALELLAVHRSEQTGRDRQDACAGSRPVANAFWLPSAMM